MVFEYQDYLVTTLVLPLFAVIVSLFAIGSVVYEFCFRTRIISFESIAKLIFVIGVSVCFIITCYISLANGGIYLIRENEKHAMVITGTIESICEPSKWVPAYKGDIQQGTKTVHGADIVIDGKEYLASTGEGFKEGDRVL